MGKEAVKLGANVFQFFTRNPRGGSVKALDLEDIEKYNAFHAEHRFGTLLAHAPYTMNPCAAKEDLRTFARNTMKEDLARLELLPDVMFNFHPGSHVKQGTEIGIPLIADALNEILSAEGKTLVLLETMAGKGSEVGRSFEELRAILDRVEQKERMGVCLDTCHVYDGGYDIIGDLDGVLQVFDDIIGLDRLKAIHLNDSKNPIGSHKDRHEKIGEGYAWSGRHCKYYQPPEAVPSAVLSGNTERGGGLRQRDFSFKKPARGKIRNDLRNEKNFQ